MGVNVAGNTTAALPSLFKPRASLVVVYPVTGVSVAVPVSAVAYVELVVGAALDTTGRYKFVADAAAVVDLAQLNTSKALSDSFGVQSFDRYELAKLRTDSFTTLDSVARTVSKLLSDAYGVSEDAVLHLTKGVFDAAGVTDDSVYALAKLIQDGVGMNDSFDVGDGSVYSFIKSVVNIVHVSEQLNRDVGKKLVDSASVLSQPMLHVQKGQFLESVATSDSAALTPALGKSDSVAAQDSETLDVTKLVTDLFSVAEVIAQSVAKLTTDSVGLSDAANLSVARLSADSFSVADTPLYNLSKLLGDSVGLTDTVTTTLVFIRNLSDSASSADFSSWSFNKLNQDSLALADQQVSVIQKAVNDGVAMQDQTGIGDGIAFVFTRSINNFVFTADNLANQSLLSKSEPTTATDSGILVMQGYCDLTYFAEDYVGVARSF